MGAPLLLCASALKSTLRGEAENQTNNNKQESEMTLEEFRDYCLALCGTSGEIIMRLNRVANGYCHTDFGDAIAIYRHARELEEKLAHLYEVACSIIDKRKEEGSAK